MGFSGSIFQVARIAHAKALRQKLDWQAGGGEWY